jgi:RNA polymerase sigma factor (sigma-70 family)
MVLGVCQRVLGNHHNSEDAFQATFLVLVRKAVSIVPREMLANWLHGVAYRTALRARSMSAKRRIRERQVTPMPEPEAVGPDDQWHDLQPLLDQELARLPDKYRIPILLCDLEGRTGKEVARQLGVAEGTIASRLSRGRGMLAKRLSRYGLAVSAGSLAEVLANSASACVPHALLSSTVKAASLLAAGQLTTGLMSAKITSLAEGVLKAMLLNKLKTTFFLFAAIGVVATGVGGLSYEAIAPNKVATKSSQQQAAQVAVHRTVAIQEQANIDKPAEEKSDDKTSKDQSQANQILDMVLNGLQAYQKSKSEGSGKVGEEQKKDPQDLYREAFLKAFQISSEIAKAKGKTERIKPTDRDEQAQVLELTIKLYVKTEAVEHAKKEIESALSRVQKTTRDQKIELQTLDEIERAVKDLRKRIAERKDGN